MNCTLTTTAVPPVGLIVKVAEFGVDDAERPVGFAVTVSVYGVEAEPAFAVSQLAELVTVKGVTAVPEAVFTIDKVCVGGLLPPCVKLKLSEPGDTVTLPLVPPLEETTRLTLTVCVAAAVVKVSVPVQVVPAAIPLWFAETEKFELDGLAVKLPEGAIVSHVVVLQLCSDADTEAAVWPVAVTVRVCAAGRVPLGVALNVIPDVLSVNGPVLVPPFTTNTTGYENGLLG